MKVIINNKVIEASEQEYELVQAVIEVFRDFDDAIEAFDDEYISRTRESFENIAKHFQNISFVLEIQERLAEYDRICEKFKALEDVKKETLQWLICEYGGTEEEWVNEAQTMAWDVVNY